MATDKCPYCGDSAWLNEAEWLNYDCGTYRSRSDDDLTRSDYCKMAERVARMQPVVDAVVAMLAIDREHRFQALSEVIEAGEKYKEGE